MSVDEAASFLLISSKCVTGADTGTSLQLSSLSLPFSMHFSIAVLVSLVTSLAVDAQIGPLTDNFVDWLTRYTGESGGMDWECLYVSHDSWCEHGISRFVQIKPILRYVLDSEMGIRPTIRDSIWAMWAALEVAS